LTLAGGQIAAGLLVAIFVIRSVRRGERRQYDPVNNVQPSQIKGVMGIRAG
jgi:hypothetical protein